MFFWLTSRQNETTEARHGGQSAALHGHPLRVAEELAMLDNLTWGRIIAGLFVASPGISRAQHSL